MNSSSIIFFQNSFSQMETDDFLAKVMAETNQNLSTEKKKKKSHHSKHKHKHSHRKDDKKEPSNAGVVTGAQALLKRSNFNESSLQPQLEGTYHLSNILLFLEELCQNGKPPVSEEDINEHFKIKIRSVKDLMKKLKEHPHVNYEGKMFSFRPNIDIADKNQLLDQLAKIRAAKNSELSGAYKGYEKDLKQLVEEGIIDQFNSNSDRRDKLYYYYDPELMKLKADADFRKLWSEVEIPDSQADRESLLRKYAGEPLKLVDQYPSLDDDEGPQQKKRKKRQSTKSTNQHLIDDLSD
ncbi:hypothetical protein TRFO_36874 [Tritrichomonas foetus]|uniref:TFIIE beta domain-containing protein n=1 Tax=Tritrichomonas foetus TaxID=1144522 RepID=A0A1J4JCS3_9EUKA|nr:hypothetical protein TRFO_36874 [Tritrichomonas foetus]|eukprot:OHS96982.1 hypothetical protein TRFO_36874 [Tritrichomonas foetus]